jgi:hypothetical protein
MLRVCTWCGGALGSSDLSAAETMCMEADRHAAGIEGLFFRSYVCHQCDEAVTFVDVVPQLGETDEALRQRQEEVEQTFGDLQAEGVVVTLAGRPSRSRGTRGRMRAGVYPN